MILVTGGTGLLGSHLLLELVRNGKKVRAQYRTKSKIDSVLSLFRSYEENADALFRAIEWVEGNVLDVPAMEEALDGVTQVYHCAASVAFNKKDHELMHKINAEGTANLVNLCLEKENVRFCHVSSVAAIGRDGSDKPIDEKVEWTESLHNSEYARSKHFAELEVWRGVEEGLEAFIVNPSLIIGPGDWSASSSAMFKRAWKGIPFYTTGGNCFVDVRDVASAMIGLMDSGVAKQRFIIGAENRTYKDVFERIARFMGKQPPTLKANSFLLGIAWRVEVVKSALTGKKPFITKEIAHNSAQMNRYDNSKLLMQLPDFRYRDLNETLAFVTNRFVAETTGLIGHS